MIPTGLQMNIIEGNNMTSKDVREAFAKSAAVIPGVQPKRPTASPEPVAPPTATQAVQAPGATPVPQTPAPAPVAPPVPQTTAPAPVASAPVAPPAPAGPLFNQGLLGAYGVKAQRSRDGFISGVRRHDINTYTRDLEAQAQGDPTKQAALQGWLTAISARDTTGAANWLVQNTGIEPYVARHYAGTMLTSEATRRAASRLYNPSRRRIQRPAADLAGRDFGDPSIWAMFGDASRNRKLYTPASEAIAKMGGDWEGFKERRDRDQFAFEGYAQQVQDEVEKNLKNMPVLPKGFKPDVLVSAYKAAAKINTDISTDKLMGQDLINAKNQLSVLNKTIEEQKAARGEFKLDYEMVEEAARNLELQKPAFRDMVRRGFFNNTGAPADGWGASSWSGEEAKAKFDGAEAQFKAIKELQSAERLFNGSGGTMYSKPTSPDGREQMDRDTYTQRRNEIGIAQYQGKPVDANVLKELMFRTKHGDVGNLVHMGAKALNNLGEDELYRYLEVERDSFKKDSTNVDSLAFLITLQEIATNRGFTKLEKGLEDTLRGLSNLFEGGGYFSGVGKDLVEGWRNLKEDPLRQLLRKGRFKSKPDNRSTPESDAMWQANKRAAATMRYLRPRGLPYMNPRTQQQLPTPVP